MARHIPWFNPRELDDSSLLRLNTGREALVNEIYSSIRQRLAHPGANKSWLITGIRGAGKSFFLRLLQAKFTDAFSNKARFVLLAEELPNIYAPHELLNEIRRMMQPNHEGYMAEFVADEPEKQWDEALKKLLTSFDEQLLVVGVENFDQILKVAFGSDEDNSRLRHLISNESRIFWIVTAVQGDFDKKYDQRLFRQFEHRNLPSWNSADHREYLVKRATLSDITFSPEMLNRIDAYSRYTGGNARAAAILASAILNKDAVSGAYDIDTLLETMSDYYRSLIDAIPLKTRRLFDALIRGGDPASQTEIAKRTKATQSEIIKAFLWLIDHGYVHEYRIPGKKSKSYRVADRLMVQFYRMRYLHPGKRSQLAILADLLIEGLSIKDKWSLAEKYQSTEEDAVTVIHNSIIKELLEIHQTIAKIDTKDSYEVAKEIFKKYPDDESFKIGLDNARDKASKTSAIHNTTQCINMVNAAEKSLSLTPLERYLIYSHALTGKLSAFQIMELEKTFADEEEQFNKLMATEGAIIKEIKSFLKIGKQYPRSASLLGLLSNKLRGVGSLESISFAEGCDWLLQAAIGWLKTEHKKYVTESLSELNRLFFKSLQEEYQPNELLRIYQVLLSHLPQFDENDQARIWEAYGIISSELAQFDVSYKAHENARILRENQKEQNASAWNIEKMAWCSSAQNNFDYAIKLHEDALNMRLNQKLLADAAWNIGQIARLRLGSKLPIDKVWGELSKNLLKTPNHIDFAIGQIGDAISDRYLEHGEPQAFALGVEVLEALAKRAEYKYLLESILRKLWIDMLEMTVPFSLLRDLLDEWPKFWNINEYQSLHDLKAILIAWFDDIQATHELREENRKLLDPDLLTTLIGLEKSLTPSTRYKLGLNDPSVTG